MPKVSIVIPTYNRASLIENAIYSALNQTYRDLEVIVVDDGSADNTEKIVQLISDPRLLYIYQKNSGQASARNTGITHSSGEYIAFLDSDDRYHSEKIDIQISILESELNIGLVYCLFHIVDSSGNLLRISGNCNQNIDTLYLVNNWPPFQTSTVMVRKKLLQDVGMFDEAEDFRRSEEWDLWIRLAIQNVKFMCVDKPLTQYCVHDRNAMMDLDLMRVGSLAVLKKTFSSINLPDDIKNDERHAYGHAFLRLAGLAFSIGEIQIAHDYFTESLTYSPELANQNIELSIELILNFIRTQNKISPYDFIDELCSIFDMSDLNPEVVKRIIKSWIYLLDGYDYFDKGDVHKARSLFIRAIFFYPNHLLNRGMLSIITKSIIGNDFYESIKKSRVHHLTGNL